MTAMRHLALAPLLFLSLPALAQPAAPAQGVAQPSLAPLIDSVKGAVVNVDVSRRAANERQELMDRFFGRRAHPRGGDDGPLMPGTGSGFIVDPKGLVITNNHVVEDAVSLKVRLEDGRSFEGEVLGRDPLTDVAVVRLKGRFDALPAVRLGDSAAMRVGDWVVAIGNPFGLAQSVSSGIISALDRNIGASRYDQFLQTDAAINPGNSGGPLFNLRGEVIGMNTAIIGSATGIGFAVPSNLIKAIAPQLERSGAVSRGWLGVGIQDVTPALAKALGLPAREGALLTSVNEGSPAQKAGLAEEDVVLSIDGEKVASSSVLSRLIALKRPEATVALSVVRGGKPLEVRVKLGVRPDLENLGQLRKPESSQGQTRIGLAFQDIDPRLVSASGLPAKGALILDVTPGSPADEAGLERGMAVVELNRRPVRSRDELMAGLKALSSGAVALLRVALPGAGGTQLRALEVP